jgi:hypothetical protein
VRPERSFSTPHLLALVLIAKISGPSLVVDVAPNVEVASDVRLCHKEAPWKEAAFWRVEMPHLVLLNHNVGDLRRPAPPHHVDKRTARQWPVRPKSALAGKLRVVRSG